MTFSKPRRGDGSRIPYLVTVPKYYALASEVATMALLRSSGLPIPEVYGYSPSPDNAAETEYITRNYEKAIVSITRQIAELDSNMMLNGSPAGGSLYYTKDLEKISGKPGIKLEDGTFCIGPDTRLHLWFGRRSQLDMDRGPYKSVEAALVAGAHKERAYLEKFGRPLLPFERVRREAYEYQKQSPLEHIENLDRYLHIAPSLIRKNPILSHFCMRHSDLQPAKPKLGEMQEIYRRRLVHYHYVVNTAKYNKLHYMTLTEPMALSRFRLFSASSDMWGGETRPLKVPLIHATERWKEFTGDDAPCPIAFDAEDVARTEKFDETQRGANENIETLRNIIGCGEDSWVPAEHYFEAMAFCNKMKEDGMALAEADPEKVLEEMTAHWPFNDMDETEYI
ncbi:hypothetical protein BDN70DRAFT_903421 [Pholiota conissans]|uniref:Uncharacterized protein n=1 Tax=Pholiota conissans TaxID=109636 RepID=A0A9P5ZE23_9AGAR|nr:hypothetical protein BDN70DRAFT_903421 [Pholiota conissans]